MTKPDSSDIIIRAANRFLGKGAADLSETERQVLERAVGQRALSQDTSEIFDDKSTFGQRLADGVATFGGSWTFLISFGVVLLAWVGFNLLLRGGAPDPYPFIFLNLLLSMLAAVQAPVIMMSQNRQAAKDRLVTSHDYEVNLKCEIEIMALHDKVDQIRDADMKSLILKQQEQIDLLTRLVEKQIGIKPASESL
ncbi:MAG: rane protein [Marmoricola sp.]|nr:rane protein [Marmoricola sp.]